MTAPYASGREYLWAELGRVEQLVRGRFELWSLLQQAAGKAREHWGLVHVTEGEVDAYLALGFIPPEQRAAAASDLVEDRRAAFREAGAEIADRVAATDGAGSYRLRRLVDEFELDPLAKALLMLVVLPEVDARYRLVYGYLQNDAGRALATVELLAELIELVEADPAAVVSRLAAGAPLVRHRLVRVGEAEAPGRRTVAADERIVRYLLGDDTPGAGPRLDEAPPIDWEGYVASEARLARLRELAVWCAHRAQGDGGLVVLSGAPGSGRRTAARALAAAAGRRLLEATVPADAESLALAYREARLQGAAVLWHDDGGLFDDGEPTPAWLRAAAASRDAGVLAFVATTEPWEPASESLPGVRVAFPEPDYRTRVALWERYLPDVGEFEERVDPAVLARRLAAAFQLTPGQIAAAVDVARAAARVRPPADARLTAEDLADACRRQSGRRLTRLAQRVEPRRGLDFEDLVLAEPSRRQLDELRTRIGLRSDLAESGFAKRVPQALSLLVMFTGSSGTGKTMAAELLAQEQGVDLYRVDLAEVVSKYIGETEKNLRRVFQEAEDANAIIFFDEADALFGKRGEVREARDRWANIEVNFLLQRVEQFAGVVILATNLRQNIDEAFMRRIHVVVEFPFPDADARLQIWQGLFPGRDQMRRPGVDELREVAERFRIPGGSIRNVVVDAAFRALDTGGEPPVVTMRHVAAAMAREYQKLGRPLTVVEFGADLYRWVEEDILAPQPVAG